MKAINNFISENWEIIRILIAYCLGLFIGYINGIR